MSKKLPPSETVMPSVAVSAIYDVWERHQQLATGEQSSIFRALFCDIARHFPNFVLEDLDYLLTRLNREGKTFYLDTLPTLGKAFETSLITLEPFQVPEGWSLRKGTRLPKFFYELFSRLMFDDGSPRWSYENQGQWDLTAVNACRYIRQLCMMWSKVEFVSTSDEDNQRLGLKETQALEGFRKRISERIEPDFSDDLTRDSLKEAARLLKCYFRSPSKYLDALHEFERTPWGRQGPGAVAGREVGCEKWAFKRWPGLPKSLFSWNSETFLQFEEVFEQPSARICMVPKDFRGPRVICIEPKENQFAQQGLMELLYRHTRSCTLTRRSISFLDTEVSRKLCYKHEFATIDMKDASDLISLNLARLVLPRWIFRLVTRYRSRTVKLPDKSVVKSNCLATMGNATCFPLETLIFWAICLGTMIVLKDNWYSKVFRDSLNLDLRVFGDDIIVPLWAADSVCRVLEASGLAINRSKSCIFTPVRESCGEWTFMREPVRIYRFRTTGITDHRSWLQWRDQLNDLGMAEMPALYHHIRDLVRGYIPFLRIKARVNKRLQRVEVYAPMFVQQGDVAKLDGCIGMYAWAVANDRTPFLKGARLRVKMRWQDIHSFLRDLDFRLILRGNTVLWDGEEILLISFRDADIAGR